ncbi:glucosamine-6-phosphate deaminase [Ereboglobus luteus]|uniref:Glucosamine/galactosamine-6-phosphate isomerase domain-containing protein n=1 Tax=Ereboglobus luteus TaxID=1796921 RepID=A0A2U8E4U3_9BACT|nr:glucosamine-6-phosphate deaminase [Ereboglobus luteus]AWI09840.1 hypothetical protein CKA38_11800 [Ereboglobus luteus]
MKHNPDTARPAHYETFGRLAVEIHPDRAALGAAAGRAAAAALRAIIKEKGRARVIFGCAPSQNEFLAELIAASRHGHTAFDWSKITAFHMDEYAGLKASHPQSFRHYLHEHLLRHVKIGKFHPIKAEAADIEKTCANYTRLLAAQPIDFICMGIGENGHIAFNDPPVADFEDTALIKLVELDAACRRQQVNDGCFATIDDVPSHALSLTVPVFRHARQLSVHVPGPLKAKAVRAALRGSIGTACPASVLRLHPNAILYLDRGSAKLTRSA